MNEFLTSETQQHKINDSLLISGFSLDKKELKVIDEKARSRMEKTAGQSKRLEQENPDYKQCLEDCRKATADLEKWQQLVITKYLQTEGDKDQIKGLIQLDGLNINLQELNQLLSIDEDREIKSSFVLELQQRLKESPEAFTLIRKALDKKAHRTVIDPQTELLNARRDKQQMAKVLSKYSQITNDSQIAWDTIIDKGIISPEAVDQSTYFISLLDFSNKIKIIRNSNLSIDTQKILEAQVALELLETEGNIFSASSLEELIGNPEIASETFLPNLIESYLNIQKILEDDDSKAHALKIKGKTIIKVVITGALVIGALKSDTRILTEYPNPPGITQTQEQQLNNKEPNLNNKKGELNSEIEGEVGISKGKAGPNNKLDKINSPRNDSLTKEDLQGGAENEIWQLEGKSVPGLYRESTASNFLFGYSDKGYETNVSDFQTITHTGKTQLTINTTTSLSVGQSILAIPIPYGYMPLFSDSKVTSQNTNVPYNIIQYGDGTYGIEINSNNKTENVNISIALAKGETKENYPTYEDKRKILSLQELPLDVQSLVQEAESINDYKKKAEFIANYIRMNFKYSLNPDYTDYIYSTDRSSEFFKRVFEVKHADCDVANGLALLPLLREAGITSRMTYGFSNENGSFGKNIKALEMPEAHGWVEIYYQDKWIPIDATPLTMDEYTKKILEENQTSESLMDSLSKLAHKFKDGTTLNEIQELLYMMLIGAKTDMSNFMHDLNNGSGNADLKLLGGLGLYVLTEVLLFTLASKNQERYRDLKYNFREALLNKSPDITNRIADNFQRLLGKITDGKIAYDEKSAVQNIFDSLLNITVLPGIGKRVSELVKISALRKRLEHNINEQGKEDINPIEIIAQSTDTEIQAISEKIKQSNLTKTLRSFERFSDESLNEYLYEKLPIHNNFRIDYQSLARKANSFSAFEEMVQKRIWFKLRKEIKINLIKHKKGFTYSQLEKEMPEEVRRGLFQIYRHTH